MEGRQNGEKKGRKNAMKKEGNEERMEGRKNGKQKEQNEERMERKRKKE